MSTPAQFYDQNGELRLDGTLVGGGGAQPYVSGSGSPIDVVTPTAGKPVYIDTLTGAVYVAFGPTSADWLIFGRTDGGIGSGPGVAYEDDGRLAIVAGFGSTPLDVYGYFGDAYAQWNGDADGLYWVGNGTDGEQILQAKTGGGTHLGTLQDADGNMSVPNDLSVDGELTVGGDPIPPGAWTDYTPVVSQGSGTIVTDVVKTKGRYLRFGSVVMATFNIDLDVGTAGQAGQPILVSLPVDARELFPSGAQNIGYGSANVEDLQTGALFARSDASHAILDDGAQTSVGVSKTLTTNDYLLGSLLYEAA